MSEELKIEVDVKANDDSAKKTLDNLIKEYNDKSLEFQVKLGKFDISGISSSIARLTSDLNKLSNIEFDGLNKLETNLKNINKLMSQQNKISSSKVSISDNAENGIKKLVGDQKESLRHIEELNQISNEMDNLLSQYNKNNEKSFKEFAKKNEDSLQYLDFLKNSSTSKAFKNVLKYKEQLDNLQKEFASLGVESKGLVEKTFEMDNGRIGVRKYNAGYEDIIGQSSERFERTVEEARKLSSKMSKIKSNINKNLDKVSLEEREILNRIDKLNKDLIPVGDNAENQAIESQLKHMLENYLSLDDLKDLDLNISNDLFIAYERFIKNFKDIKQEYKDVFGEDEDFIKLNAFDNVQKVVDNLDKATNSVNLDNLREKLTNAFDIDDKIIANIEKIENALKQLNSMSELTQKSLFSEGVFKTGEQLNLESKIKEYLNLDKQINDAFTKLSKAELNRNDEVVASLNKEIDLLRQKQALVTLDLRGNSGFSDEIREQVRLQEELNRAISQTQQAEYKNSFIDKLHTEAKKINEEFDEIRKQQEKINNFEMPNIFDTKGLKSYVDYLDSAADGIKRIVTQNLGTPGKDITTTLYGDGTEVRKVTNNIEKTINQLATAYRQVDNEITRLIKSRDKLEASGDYKTVQVLDKQISSWKEMQQGIENATKSAKVYDQVIEKVQNSISKNKNSIDINKSQLEVNIEVNNEKALKKFEEFKTKALSNLQELERKYEGTDLFDEAVKNADELRKTINQLGDSLDTTKRIDLSNLSSEFRNINQAITQTKRDMNDLNKNLKSGFFSNFGEEFTSNLMSFTAGELLADSIRSVASSLKDLVLEYDSAMTNLKKVANPEDIMNVDQLDAIGKKANEIAKNVGQSTQDTIQAIADTVQMTGLGMEESIKVAEQTMKLANVTEMSTQAASEGVATMLASFNLDPLKEVPIVVDGVTKSTNEMVNSFDVLNHVGNNFAISSDGLLDAIQSGANVLATYGVSLNDTVAMITAANSSLQDTSRVGNGLKTIGINLAGIKANAKSGTLELNKTAKTLKEVAGIDVLKEGSKDEIKDMATIIAELGEKWKDFSDYDRAGLSEAIAGKEQAAVFQSLMSNLDTMKKVQQELASGQHFESMEKENAAYVDSISGKLNKLKEVWVGIFTKVFDSNSAKGLLDVLISVSEAIDKVVGSLDEMGILLPSIIGMFGGVFSGFKGTNFITNALKGANKEMSIMQKGVTVLGSGLSKAGTFLGNFITQGLLIGGITILVQGLVKAWDEAANGLKNAEKEITNSIESINSEINQDTQDLKYLEETEKRYNELIKKKEEYSNTPIESMSEEQLAEMKELEEITNNLAKMFPELVIGYDSNNQPILLMADDMETLQERTKEQIELNKELLRVKREELAENARKQYQEGNFFGLGSGIEESVSKNQAIYDSLYNSMIENESSYTKAVLEGDERRANKIKKTLDTQKEELNRYYKENLQLYQEYTEKEIQAQQSAFDQIQTIKGYDNLDKDASQKVQTFMDNLNWVNMDESQYSTWLSSFDEIIKLAGEGSPKLQKWSDALELANEKYAATGNVDSYNKSISELAKTISKDLGIDYETVFAGLETMVKPLTEAETKMNSFLESFGKTRYDLLNGDEIAMQLAEQFQAVEDTINKVFNNREFQETGVIKYDLMTEIANSDELPDQIQSLASALAKDGVSKAESDLMLELMMSIRSGDKEMIETTIENVNSKLKELGMEEHTIDIKTLFDESGTKKVEKLEEKLKNLPKETKTLVETDVLGEEDLETLKSLLNDSTLKDDKVINILLKNQEAIKNAGGLKEWLDSIPKETWAKLGIKSENIEEAKKDLEEVSKKQDEVDSKDVNLSVNKGELQGSVEDFNKLIEYSTKLKDGEYQISFKSDTTDAINQIDNLKLAVNNLSNQFMQIPSTTITLNTALAAQNISGLLTRIEQVKTAIGGIKGKTIQIITALAAMNLSGLITRVNQYRDAINNTPDKTTNIHTSQSAKNLSGLIRKIESYNETTISQKTVKVNVSNAISQVQTLLNKINALPRTKTVTVKVSQSGSATPKIVPRSVFSTNGQENTGENPVSANISPLSEVSTHGDTDTVVSSNPTASPMLRRISSTDAKNMFDYDVDIFKKLENSLKKISNELDIISKKSENAFGQEKINYLQRQIELLKQQQQLQHSLAEDMRVQQDVLKNYLLGKGFTFDAENNIANYSQKLLAYEKHVKSLEDKANANKDNDKLQAQYDGAKKDLDEIKNALNSYLDLTFSKIPDASKEWWELNNTIKDTEESIKDVQIALKYADEEINIGKYQNELDKLNKQLGLLDKQIDNLNGQNKITAINKKIELLKQEQQNAHNLANAYRDVQRQVQETLRNNGFNFDSNGDITNYEHLNSFIGTEKLEELKEIIEEYKNLSDDIIPGLSQEWWDMEESIKDCISEVEQLKISLKNIDASINVGKYEGTLNKVRREINRLDEDIERAFGSRKEELIQKKIELIRQEQQELHKLANSYRDQAKTYKDYLSGVGFEFDSSGMITNLENIKNLTNDARYEIIKESLEEYIDLTQSKIPDLSEEWWDLEDSIDDAKESIEEARKELEEFLEEARVEALVDRFNDLSNSLDLIDKKLKHATGKDRLDLISEKLDIIKQQEVELQKHQEYYNNKKNSLQQELGQLGFNFDKTGNITNYVEQLEKLANSSDNFEDIKEKLQDYLDIQEDKLPDIISDLVDLENAYKDVLKEQLNTTKEIEDKITEMYKKQVEDRIDAMNKETNKKVESLKKQKEAYNKYREEANYKDEYEEKLANINDIQRQLDIAMRDTSLQGQKKVQELQKLLADAQKELDKFTQDKIDSDINEAFDKEINNIEETNKNAIEALEKEWSESKIAEMVSQAISSGIFEGIDGKVSGLQDAMLEFAQETGELFGVMGTVIKSELISNLDIAMDTFRDLGNIIKNLDLEKFSTLSSGFNVNMKAMPSMASSASSIVLNAPMINIEGDVNKDVVEDLKSFSDKLVNDVINKISSSIR